MLLPMTCISLTTVDRLVAPHSKPAGLQGFLGGSKIKGAPFSFGNIRMGLSWEDGLF